MSNISNNSLATNGTNMSSSSISNTVFSVLTAILITFTVIGNVMTVIVIYKTPRLWDTSSLLLGNMAVADLVAGMVCMPPVLISMNIRRSYLSSTLCIMAGYINTVVIGASLQTLAFICSDRCIAILRPLHYHMYMSTNVLKVLIILSWVLPMVVSILPLLGLQQYGLGYYQFVDYLSMCWIDVMQVQKNRAFLLLIYSLVVFVLTSVIVSCILILRVIHKLKNTVINISLSSGIDRTISKSSITMMLIVGVFVICLMPAVIITFATSITGVRFHADVYQIIIWFTYLNSAINPILYGFSNQQFRRSYNTLWNKRVGIFRFCKRTN